MLSFVSNSSDLKKIISIISKSSNKNFDNSINFESKGNEILISNFSRESNLEFKFQPIKILDEGSFNININIFINAIKELKDEELLISLEESKSKNKINLKISTKKTKINLVAEKKKDFQVISIKDYNAKIEIKLEDLIQAFKSVNSCLSNQLDRPALCGILFHLERNDNLTTFNLVTTDGRKLAISKFPTEEIQDLKQEIIIPRKILEEIQDFSEFLSQKKITLSIKEKEGLFSFDEVLLIKFSFIDSKFPNYKSILVPETGKYIDIKTKDLISCLRRLSGVESSTALNLTTSLKIQKDIMTFKVQSTLSEIEDELDCKTFNFEEEIIILVHLKSFLEIISTIDLEFIRITVNTNKTPILIKPIASNIDLSYILALVSA